jgi:hypothetical protein
MVRLRYATYINFKYVYNWLTNTNANACDIQKLYINSFMKYTKLWHLQVPPLI